MDQLAYRHLVGVAYTEDEMKAIAAEVCKYTLFLTVSYTYTYILCECSSFITFINVIHVNNKLILNSKGNYVYALD